MKPVQFAEILSGLKLEDSFNPYADRCDIHDLADAPQYRTQALLNILETAASVEIDSLWIGRDLGYRGGRRTGLAFTDDLHFSTHASRWCHSANRPN